MSPGIPNEHDGIIAYAPCWLCGRGFMFHVDLVPSVPIDPETNRPPDVDERGKPQPIDPEAQARAVKMPICEHCFGVVNERRVELGQPLWTVDPGAYL